MNGGIAPAYLLRPLPYHEPEQLQHLFMNDPQTGWTQSRFSLLQYRDWKEQVKSFSDLAIYNYTGRNVTGRGEPELLTVGRLSANLLPLLGIYGIIAHAAEQRTQEIGIRMALGASRGDVLWMVLRQGGKLVAIGVGLGLLLALLGLQVLSTQYAAAPEANWLLIGGLGLLLAVVALAACSIPARRAAGLNPIVALRHE